MRGITKWKRLADGWFKQPQGTTTQIIPENALMFRCPMCKEITQVKFRYTTKTWEGHAVTVIPEVICGGASCKGSKMNLVNTASENIMIDANEELLELRSQRK